MESITIIGFGACVAFFVNYSLVDYTWLEHLSHDSMALAYEWDFEPWHCGTGFIIGLVSAVLSTCTMIIVGITKQIFARISRRLERYKFLSAVIPPTIGGLVIGNNSETYLCNSFIL
jgi:hypothetical protein